MAGAMGMGAGEFSSPFSSSSSMQQQLNSFLKTKKKNNNNNNNGFNRVKFVSASSSSIADPYETLRIRRCASESEIKKAFRRLALQYHPDVCREDDCKVKFQHINEAYDIVLSNLRGEEKHGYDEYDEGIDEQFRGMNDDEWDLWEEWMGWEGAGIRDYSSHINPYI